MMTTDETKTTAASSPLEARVRPLRPKLAELAARIREHLARLEADTEWNQRPGGGRRLWCSGAAASGNRVFCTYVSYQGHTSMTRVDAERYLAKLDEGFKGRHFEALREQQAA